MIEIDKDKLIRKVKECKRMGIEYEVIIKERGESMESLYKKFKDSKIISEQLMLIGRI